MSVLDRPEARLALSLLLGLLLGAERERRSRERGVAAVAGLRTFGIVGLLGGLSSYSELPYATIAGGVGIAALAVSGFLVESRTDPEAGLTTEVALVLTYVLGALALEHPSVAGSAAIVTTLLLHLRTALHRFVRDALTEDEVHDALSFLVFAFVVLPLAPDVDMGPYAAINPQRLCRFVLVVIGVSASGYLAQRTFGARYGLVVSGFGAGFVSSSGTIAAMGLRVKNDPALLLPAVAGSLASSISTVVQYALILVAIDRALFTRLVLPLGLALVVALGGTLFYWRAGASTPADAPVGRAFRWGTALLVGLGAGVTSIVSAAAAERAGNSGMIAVSATAGLVDAHASAASVASLHHAGQLATTSATIAILAALSSNTVTKIVMASIPGSFAFAVRVGGFVVAMAAAAWLGLLLH